jgi:hypothetical protein
MSVGSIPKPPGPPPGPPARPKPPPPPPGGLLSLECSRLRFTQASNPSLGRHPTFVIRVHLPGAALHHHHAHNLRKMGGFCKSMRGSRSIELIAAAIVVGDGSHCKEERVMRHFAVVLALAVAAWTQAMASEPPHKRHVRMPRQAEVDTAPGCPGYQYRARAYLTPTTDRTGPIRTGRRATILPAHTPKAVASSPSEPTSV